MTTTHPCPRDLSARVTGDTVQCSDCGGWFQVIWKQGGKVELLSTYERTPGAMVGRRLRGKR